MKKTLKVLFIGDVVGKPGMRLLSKLVPQFKKNDKYDLVCINGENSAGGFGITKNGALKLKKYGCDAVTTGNHIIDREDELDKVFNIQGIIRPLNYESTFPGSGWMVIERNNTKCVIVNLQGIVFMPEIPKTLPPFLIIKDYLTKFQDISPIIIIDFHAEATAEKIAMKHFLDGKISALICTHTHVQTKDEAITKNGTAYITDVGMTGSFDSVIGMQKGPIVRRFLGKTDEQFRLAKNDVRMDAVEFEINNKTGKAISIRSIQIAEDT